MLCRITDYLLWYMFQFWVVFTFAYSHLNCQSVIIESELSDVYLAPFLSQPMNVGLLQSQIPFCHHSSETTILFFSVNCKPYALRVNTTSPPPKKYCFLKAHIIWLAPHLWQTTYWTIIVRLGRELRVTHDSQKKG